MMRLLVSVRNVDEALVAAEGGADLIDLKEPRSGALGGVAVPTIKAIVATLRRHGMAQPISATVGDLPMHDAHAILAQVEAVGACGVTYVKVGIPREAGAAQVLAQLARCGRPVVPVLIADEGLDPQLLRQAIALRFPALMIDTFDKRGGSLFDVLPMSVLRGFVQDVRAGSALAGLAGSLQLAHAEQLRVLAPDVAGFRGAVCAGNRSDALDVRRLRELVRTMHPMPA